jgi:hypothetical protein
MPLTFQQDAALMGQISSVAAQIVQVQNSIGSLKTEGTVLYNNANLLTKYPTDGPGIRTSLLAINSALNTVLAALTQINYPQS